MFDNWIDLSEPLYLLRRLMRDATLRRRVLTKLRLSGKARTASAWSHTESPPTHWWDIPAVQSRCNRLITGNADLRHERYFAGRYAAGKSGLTAISLGCGTGAREVRWARTGIFGSIDAYDLSERRIRVAKRLIAGTPEEAILRYRAADIYGLDLPRESYDVVLFEHSLHHFSPLEALLIRMKAILKPGGLLVANEFIGPSRFQWSDRQLAAVNDVLDMFPARYATLYGSRSRRLKAVRPSKLAMWIADPSEARESSEIVSILKKHFDVKEFRGYGGTILQLLFAGIAHHFVAPDAEAEKLLDRCFAAEDRLLALHEIEHDFAFIVCSRKADPSSH